MLVEEANQKIIEQTDFPLRQDGQLYTLQGINEDVSLDELLRIAESIQ